MRITYTPDNFSGAKCYLVSINACAASDVRSWLEAGVIDALAKAVENNDDFPVIYRGIGFFYSVVGRSSAPIFAAEFEPDKAITDDGNALLDVFIWVAADAIPG